MACLLLSDQMSAIGLGLILECQSLASLLFRSTRTAWRPLCDLLLHLVHLFLRFFQSLFHTFQITSHAFRFLLFLAGFCISSINLLFQAFILHLQHRRLLCSGRLRRQRLVRNVFAATHNLVNFSSLGLLPGASQAQVEVTWCAPQNSHSLRHVRVTGAAKPFLSGTQLLKDVATATLQPLWDRPFRRLDFLLLLLHHLLLRRN
mmetsp:Transcript_49940/g.109087  ORF Transcript_49940/g.109087 Transcript_49940/m.109087 type:complete len:204 (-) Transcript_49940:172-783(-)